MTSNHVTTAPDAEAPTSDSASGKMAQTVLGPVPGRQLGITLPHEHLMIDMAIWFEEPSDPRHLERAHQAVNIENLGWVYYNQYNCLDNVRLLDETVAIHEGELFRKAGGRTIVDVTTHGLGPDRAALKRISQATGLQVIAGTGYYILHGDDARAFDEKSEEEIADEMIGDLLEGRDGIRSGIIGEIGCSRPLSDREEKSLRAAARAQRETGAAVTIHPGRGEDSPMEILRLLEKAGADLTRVIMGHIDRTGFLPKTIRDIASTGCSVEYDIFGGNPFYPLRFGVFRRPCDRERIEQIMDLIADGYLDRILISQDICLKTKLTRYGRPGYAHILENIVPQMLARGMTHEQLHTIMTLNPARLLAFA